MTTKTTKGGGSAQTSFALADVLLMQNWLCQDWGGEVFYTVRVSSGKRSVAVITAWWSVKPLSPGQTVDAHVPDITVSRAVSAETDTVVTQSLYWLIWQLYDEVASHVGEDIPADT